ncbi:MDR family NADP-dependent oxidoreductase [Streptomyces ficellus]|uniref:NADP-dependent oxidoreductase n=1 Tax=Streptomyces ficellus TaxID=1977088 RepID=A0A6I6FJ11_9ACTN|nr:NADP-dependent oxidoreductase [Streptomyces ficellus]QGV77508.1 NADP-dependent oxidoreductase [Streptomyces ficellus]
MTTPRIPSTAQEVHLAARPDGDITLDHFAVVETEVRRPGSGEVLVRNEYMALAYAMSFMLSLEPDPDLPFPTFEVGEPLWFPAVGTVVASESPDLAVGDVVSHNLGWREYAVAAAEEFTKLDAGSLPDVKHFLAQQGPTAFWGVKSADIREGDTVFVSGAAGGVGSLAGQIAKCLGAKRVIGSAGSDEKVEYVVKELGFDAAFNYKEGSLGDRLAELAPDGVDVYFDTVGGDQFEAAMQNAAHGARFVLCGALSGKNPTLDLDPAVGRDVVIKGFSTPYTPDAIADWQRQFGEWLREGRIVFPHSVVEGGPEQAPKAFLGLLGGEYKGQVLVRLARD